MRQTGHSVATGLLLAGALLCICVAARAAEPEYGVKARFLPLLIQFVTWPPDAVPAALSPWLICVLGEDPFGAALDEAVQREQALARRKLAVKRARRLDEVRGCQVLFIAGSMRPRHAEILAALRSDATLTVGDVEGFASSGGIIGFVLVGGKVRLEINAEAAARARLKISAQLMGLGKAVGNGVQMERP